MRTAYLFICNGYADWEPASALAELRRSFEFSVRTVGLTTEGIISMAGLKITPDIALADFSPQAAEILVLPGGDAWMKGELVEVSKAVNAMVVAGRPVAAICAATLALAHAGLLDHREHTSNGQGFIAKYVPTYRGSSMYRPVRAVRDGLVITANGLAPFAFAAEVFRTLVPDKQQDIESYERLYANGLLD